MKSKPKNDIFEVTPIDNEHEIINTMNNTGSDTLYTWDPLSFLIPLSVVKLLKFDTTQY